MFCRRIVPAPPWITIAKLGADAAICDCPDVGQRIEAMRPAHAARRRSGRDIFVGCEGNCGVRTTGRTGGFNKVSGSYSFPLRMKSSNPSRLRKLRLEAADAPRIDLAGPTRRERDLLGERDVPAEALYGIQTLRAIENFAISGIELREFPTLVSALATVKEAAALANHELKLLDREIVDAISQAAGEIREGRHHEYFRVDMIQGGAGTSSNMNANEVMANRALEILGKQHGEYEFVHPNNHVNLSQS